LERFFNRPTIGKAAEVGAGSAEMRRLVGATRRGRLRKKARANVFRFTFALAGLA
jgi:hypothetical protein